MKSEEFKKAVQLLSHTRYVNAVIGVVGCYWDKLPFDEQVELINLAHEKIRNLYGFLPNEKREV